MAFTAGTFSCVFMGSSKVLDCPPAKSSASASKISWKRQTPSCDGFTSTCCCMRYTDTRNAAWLSNRSTFRIVASKACISSVGSGELAPNSWVLKTCRFHRRSCSTACFGLSCPYRDQGGQGAHAQGGVAGGKADAKGKCKGGKPKGKTDVKGKSTTTTSTDGGKTGVSVAAMSAEGETHGGGGQQNPPAQQQMEAQGKESQASAGAIVSEVATLLKSLRLSGEAQLRVCQVRKIAEDGEDAVLIDGGATHCLKMATAEEWARGHAGLTWLLLGSGLGLCLCLGFTLWCGLWCGWRLL